MDAKQTRSRHQNPGAFFTEEPQHKGSKESNQQLKSLVSIEFTTGDETNFATKVTGALPNQQQHSFLTFGNR